MDSIESKILQDYKKLNYDEDRINVDHTQMMICNIELDIDEQDIKTRLSNIKSIIEKNLPSFQRNCIHIDNITNLLKYIDTYIVTHNGKQSNWFWDTDSHLSQSVRYKAIACTVHYLCGEKWIDVLFSKYLRDWDIIKGWPVLYSACILLDDCDLYAVFDSLSIYDKPSFPWILTNIWVQESIHQKFMEIMETYFVFNCKFSICTFRTKEEVIPEILNKEPLTSVFIWSENVIRAKIWTQNMKVRLVFINSSTIFHGDIMLPITETIQNMEMCKQFVQSNSDIENKSFITYKKKDGDVKRIYNLFYNNEWNVPDDKEYWLNNDNLESVFADASISDVEKCVKAVKDGFKKWSSMSCKHKVRYLENYVCKLECFSFRKDNLAQEILSWINTMHFYENSFCTITDKVELQVTRIPAGIIVLTGHDLKCLLLRTLQALICGNSVIIIPSKRHETIIEYYEMFSSCGFPAGVINLLTSANLNTLLKDITRLKGISSICSDDLSNTIIDENKCHHTIASLIRLYYIKYTIPKYALLPLM